MKFSLVAIAAAGVLVGTQAVAADAQALAQKNACMSCHQVDKKVVGPAFKEIAAKYKGDKTAEAKLVEKVKKGGSGVWGPVPMPPNAQVPDADIKAIVQWVLSIK
jgi:cytochrome c